MYVYKLVVVEPRIEQIILLHFLCLKYRTCMYIRGGCGIPDRTSYMIARFVLEVYI